MKIAHATKEGGENDSRGAVEAKSTRRGIERSGVVARASLERILIVSRAEHRARLTALVGARATTHWAPTPEEAAAFLEENRAGFVLADAESCTERLLGAVSVCGLSRVCAFLAAPGDVERLVQAYASQFAFRVLSHDVQPEEFQAFLRSALHPRGAERHSLPGITVELELEDGRVTVAELLDLSNRGLAVRMEPQHGLLLPGTPVTSVCLDDAGYVLLDGVQGVVRYVEVLTTAGAGAVAYKVGLELRRPPAPTLPDHEQAIVEPLRVRALLGEGLRRSPLTAWIADTNRLIAVGRALVDLSQAELRVVTPQIPELEVGDVAEGRFDLAGSSYSFLASVLTVSPHVPGYSLRLPRALRVVRQRKSMRFCPEVDRPILISPHSPFSADLGVRPALNITASGAAFELLSPDELLPIGTRISHLVLRLDERQAISCRATVRTLAPGSGGRLICGVEFEDLTDGDKGRIAQVISRAEQPNVRDGSGTSFEDLWQFFTDTRFLYPEKLARMDVPAVKRTVETLLSQPNDLSKTTLVVANDKIQAHLSGVRAYERCWLMQHMAAMPGGKATLTRGKLLNLAVISYLEQLHEIEWIKLWFRPENRWPSRVWGGFARRIDDARTSNLQTYRYMVSSTDAGDSTDPEVTVRLGVEADHHRVEAYFVAARSPALMRSDDLTSAALTLPNVGRAYASAGLERRRELLVAERHGRFAGFALLEVSSLGLNFSELTNAFRVFVVEPDDGAYRALISTARRRYAALNRSRCVALTTPEDGRIFEAMSFVHSKNYTCWTWHRSHYLGLYEHVLRMRS